MPFEKPCPFVKKDKKMMLLLLLLFAKACVQNINVLFNNETNKQKVVSHHCVRVCKYVGSRNQKLQNRTLVG